MRVFALDRSQSPLVREEHQERSVGAHQHLDRTLLVEDWGGAAVEERCLIVVDTVGTQQFRLLDGSRPIGGFTMLGFSRRLVILGGDSRSPAARVKRTNAPVRRSNTPLKSPAVPTGHVSGVGRSLIRDSISSSSSRGSQPGRSSLSITVMIGIPRCLHT